MTRTDRKGWNIKLFIEAEIIGEQITVEDLYVACDITKSKYYGDPSKGVAGRAEAEDFPNPLELRNVAEYYQLSSLDFLNLLVEFGWGPVIPDILEGFAKGGDTPFVRTASCEGGDEDRHRDAPRVKLSASEVSPL